MIVYMYMYVYIYVGFYTYIFEFSFNMIYSSKLNIGGDIFLPFKGMSQCSK